MSSPTKSDKHTLNYTVSTRLNRKTAAKLMRMPEYSDKKGVSSALRQLVEERVYGEETKEALAHQIQQQSKTIAQLRNRTDEIAESLYLFMFLFWKTVAYDTQDPTSEQRGEYAMEQWRHFLNALRTNLGEEDPLFAEVAAAAAESGYQEQRKAPQTTEEDLEQNR